MLHQSHSISALPTSVHRSGITPCCFPEIIQGNLSKGRCQMILRRLKDSIRRIVVLLKNTVQVFRCNSDSWLIAIVSVTFKMKVLLTF